jgi:transcriptional regulator with XRE-family HTH domain
MKHRKNVGLSQESLAKAAGVSRAHMGRIENTRHAVNIDTLEKIAVALDVDAAALLQPLTD